MREHFLFDKNKLTNLPLLVLEFLSQLKIFCSFLLSPQEAADVRRQQPCQAPYDQLDRCQVSLLGNCHQHCTIVGKGVDYVVMLGELGKEQKFEVL